MGQNKNLELGKDAFTLAELLQKAAQFKGLILQKNNSKACSAPFKTYNLNERIIAILADHRIRQQDRPDDIFTLVDENPQKKLRGMFPATTGTSNKLKAEPSLIFAFP